MKGHDKMTQSALDRETILETIRGWPADQQIALMQEILGFLRRGGVPGVGARGTATSAPEAVWEPPLAPPDSKGLVGLLATDRPPPTDEEVKQWLEERRVEKYGR